MGSQKFAARRLTIHCWQKLWFYVPRPALNILGMSGPLERRDSKWAGQSMVKRAGESQMTGAIAGKYLWYGIKHFHRYASVFICSASGGHLTASSIHPYEQGKFLNISAREVNMGVAWIKQNDCKHFAHLKLTHYFNNFYPILKDFTRWGLSRNYLIQVNNAALTQFPRDLQHQFWDNWNDKSWLQNCRKIKLTSFEPSLHNHNRKFLVIIGLIKITVVYLTICFDPVSMQIM